MAIRIITPPSVSPVTLEQTKSHLNVDFSDDDSLIDLYIKAATNSAEKFCGRAFVEQTLEMVIDGFPAAGVMLEYPPLISVTSIEYDDADGNVATVSPPDYIVDNVSQPGWVVPVSSWPSTLAAINAVRIEYVAGYAATGSPADYTAAIPFAIKAAILMTVGTLYQERATIVVGVSAQLLPWAAEQLLRQYRVYTGVA